eukprot:s334_g12.t1
MEKHFQGILHADVILTQGSAEWRAGLAAIYPAAGLGQELCAISVPPWICGLNILEESNAIHLHHRGICTVFHGWQEIPIDQPRNFFVHNGDSFAIHVRPRPLAEVRDIEDASSLMATMHNAPHPENTPVTNNPNAVQVEDEQPDQPDISDSDSEMRESEYSLSTAAENLGWHSVAVYNTESNSARGRVPFAPYAAFFRRVRALLGLHHHDVARIVQIKPTPDDLAHCATTPLLILRHDDFYAGDTRRAVLMDVEHHGSHFSTIVETDRYVIKLPEAIHRSRLLAWVHVDRYCSAMRERCLVWHRGNLIPRQAMALLQLEHGDYIRIAIPPFRHQEVPTRLATQCTQAGFSAAQTLRRYRERGEDTDSLYSLIQGGQTDHDHMDMMQRQASMHFSPTGNTMTDQPAGHESPQHTPWQHHLQLALECADIECEEEGPVGYIDTWYLHGDRPYVTEHVRTYRCLRQEASWWFEDVLELWTDRIDRSKPISFFWVHPVPRAHPLRFRLGHLIIAQNIGATMVPTHLTTEFVSFRGLHFGIAAALLSNPVSADEVQHLARLAHHCRVKQCSLRQGTRYWQADETREVFAGAGLTFQLVQPGLRFKLGDEHVVEPHLEQQSQHAEVELDDIPVPPPLAEETHFIRQLYDIWDRLAQIGPAQMERLLRVETWYVEGHYVTINDQHRNVVLADDYWTWEATILHRWRDFVIEGVEADFTVVTPTPPIAHDPNEIHIIVYQRVAEFDYPSMVTIVDDGMMHGEPYTTAVILPPAVTIDDIIRKTGKAYFCPPLLPTSMCHCWHRALAVDHIPFANRHGYAFDLHVQRRPPESAWSDEEGDPAAASSMSLLQVHATRHTVDSGERRTLGQVAHTRGPPASSEVPPEPPCPSDWGDATPQFQSIGFDKVYSAFNIFDSHFFLPVFDIVDLPNTHVSSAWTHSWWDMTQPCDEFYIYFDGSFAKSPPEGELNSSAAVAAFARTSTGWKFAGALSTSLSSSKSSYAAELNGALMANKFLFDLLKIHEALFGWIPRILFPV